MLPAHGLASVYGPSASGKSFLALDMAAAVASGREWFGYRVKPSPVVYCALEGESGFRLRVAAWEQANGCALPDSLRLVLQPFKLTEPQDVPDMAAALLSAGAGAVTTLDTLNRAAPEADENASADMSRILEAAKTLQRLTGGLVILMHHTGKDTTKGLRGHSTCLLRWTLLWRSHAMVTAIRGAWQRQKTVPMVKRTRSVWRWSTSQQTTKATR